MSQSPVGLPPSGPEAPAPRGVTEWLGQLFSTFALACFRRPLVTLLTFALLVGGLGFAASRLKLDPDIAELLPPSYESVQDIEKLRERFGGIGYVVLLLEGGEPEARRNLARELTTELERLDSVSYVELEKPSAYVKNKALWLFEQPDLVELEGRIERRYQYEINRKFLDLDDEEPPVVETRDLIERFERRFGVRSDPEASTARRSDYYEDERRLAVFVRPSELATHLDFARRVVGEVEGVLERSAYQEKFPGISIELTGRYKKRVDLQEVLGSDLGRMSILSMGLVALYLFFHFRRLSALVLLLIPLQAGLVLAYGLAAVTFGTLNILTTFLGAILIGIGIDNGIHLLGRVHEETGRGASLEEAIGVAFRDAGRVSFAAACTTAAAFLCLMLTDFRAFREFGSLTAAGVVLVFLSYLVLLPALLQLFSRFRWLKNASETSSLGGTEFLERRAGWVVIVCGALVLFFVGAAPGARFDADLSRLDDADLPSFHLDREVTTLLGRSQTPLVAFPADAEEARAAAELVRTRMREAGEAATIGDVVTLSEFLPEDLEQKEPHVRQIQRMLSRLSQGELHDELEAKIPGFSAWLEEGPPKKEELPESLRQVLAPETNRDGGPLLLLYPRVSMGESEAVQRTSDQVRHLDLASGAVVRTAGESMILADILRLIAEDGPRILLVTLLLVVVVLRLTLGNFRLAALATIPAVLTLVVTAGAAHVLGISFNVLNVIILPILLGIGVDDGAHLVARLEQGEPLAHVWKHTGADVTGAILTDVFGFGVLAFAAHPGLASLGKVALVGLSVNFLLCVVLLPAVCAVFPSVVGARSRPPEHLPS